MKQIVKLFESSNIWFGLKWKMFKSNQIFGSLVRKSN